MLRYAFDPPQSRTSEGSVSNWEHAGVGLPLGHRYRSELGPCYVGDGIKEARSKSGLFIKRRGPYAAASFNFLSARTFRRTVAGLASNQRSSPVKGSLPKRFFFAGTS